MTRWPPVIWVMVVVGSLLLVVGYNGADVSVPALVLGGLLVLGATGLAFFLAFGTWGGRPQVTGVSWMIPAAVVFAVLCAVAGLASGAEYAVAMLIAGLIPLTAATLITATTRAKTVGDEDDGRRETTAAQNRDPFPGVGADDETPLGDTPEHSDAERVAQPDRRFERRQDVHRN
jgi:hypothetical protein